MRTFLRITTFILGITSLAMTFTPTASAITPDWQAGNIMSDAVFTNNSSMSVSQIQDFLNSKVPVCDTNGVQNSEMNNVGVPDYNGNGSIQRWEWGKAKYNQTTFPCLKDVRVADGRTAAQVIYDVAQEFVINPQALIVLLQKEQGLVTDTWPTSTQYRSATGYGCPDTAPCNSDYYWLDNQLEWSGRMFRAIMNDSPSWYTPKETGNEYMGYNPNSDCGGSTIFIQNRATQALYNYTPYQPNDYALNGGSSSGYPQCGAFGNRNFYTYFRSWFGSTRGGDLISYDLQLVSPITVSPSAPRPGEPVTVTYSVKNISGSTVTWDADILQCRNTTLSCDSTLGGARSIAPNETVLRSFTVTPTLQNSLTLTPYYRIDGVWYRMALNTSGMNSLTVWLAGLSMTPTISMSPKAPNISEIVHYSFTVTNPHSTPLTIDGALLQCRYEVSTICDSPMSGQETIAPGASKTYNYYLPKPQSGTYTITPYYRYNFVWYKYTNGDTPKSVYVSNIHLTENPQITPSEPVPNEPFTVTYTLRNSGTQSVDINRYITQCRRDSTINCDPSAKPSTTLDPGETVSVSDSFTASRGSYRFLPYFDTDNEWHTLPWIQPISFNVAPYVADLRIVGSITTNSPVPGEPLTASYSVRNFGSKTAYYQAGLLQCRYNTNSICDSSDYGTVSIAPGATRTFNDTLVAHVKVGSYKLRPYYRQNNNWYEYRLSDGSGLYEPVTTIVNAYSPVLTVTDIHTTPSSPTFGQTGVVEYTIRNDGSRTVYSDFYVTQCRVNTSIMCDPAFGPAFTLEPGESKTITDNFTYNRIGAYRFAPYYYYNNQWYLPRNTSGDPAIMNITIN